MQSSANRASNIYLCNECDRFWFDRSSTHSFIINFVGIFLAEFGQTNPVASIVRFFTSIITAVPSIVVGVFAYGVIVLVTKGFSAIAENS